MREIPIETSFEFTDPILCDGKRIGQLLSNLVGNALTARIARPTCARRSQNK
jgi:hypothetical protein